ncbi:hypothetical protein HPB47_020636 [Ixodes persulcatus]|uniref:Uncharacterized protein n=1 Tax=Ixodes persulcatus TaxID=34615 RepID=A0AC60QET8_IXOPE|nr:hypothetical protein HPB47_020636 [Ixodes persulcatus]
METASLEEWSRALLTDVSDTTRAIQEEPISLQEVDCHLLHMWEARNGLHKSWKKQKHNRKLKLRIAELDRQIEDYANALTRQHWHQICDSLRESLGNAKTWHLLRHLLDPNNTKTEQRKNLSRLLYQYDGSTQTLLQNLRAIYIGHNPPTTLEDYTGLPNADLDSPILESEVRAALHKIRTQSAPGENKINNKTLRNLDDASIQALTQLFSKCWEEGALPQEWKHAKVKFIPKRGKPLTLNNLRPISLTSCVGKLFEHITLSRMQNHLEDCRLLPVSMIGFRPNLSTQHIFLQLNPQIYGPEQTRRYRAIVGLDLKKAFDNVLHTTIMQTLNGIRVGTKTYNYIRAFLTDRTATLNIEDIQSPPIALGRRGTPQSSVLSPFLFSLALLTLPNKLVTVPGLSHSLYADDITIWADARSEEELEGILQQGIDIVSGAVKTFGLACSPEKSEYMIVRPSGLRRNTTKFAPCRMKLLLEGETLPTRDNIRILGMTFQSNVNRHSGMGEADLLRLIQAFVISRVTYAAPYMRPLKLERDKLNRIIRGPTKWR